MRSTLMIIDMNASDIEAVDEVKTLILESVNTWKNYKNRLWSRAVKGPVCREVPMGRGMFTLNSRDLRMRFSMISSRMIFSRS